jgi:hypothetical protein
LPAPFPTHIGPGNSSFSGGGRALVDLEPPRAATHPQRAARRARQQRQDVKKGEQSASESLGYSSSRFVSIQSRPLPSLTLTCRASGSSGDETPSTWSLSRSLLASRSPPSRWSTTQTLTCRLPIHLGAQQAAFRGSELGFARDRHPTVIDTHTILVGGLCFTVDVAGPADGGPMLLLHGFQRLATCVGISWMHSPSPVAGR